MIAEAEAGEVRRMSRLWIEAAFEDQLPPRWANSWRRVHKLKNWLTSKSS